MTTPAEQFAVVRRGYDQTAVQRRLEELAGQVKSLASERDQLAAELEAVSASDPDGSSPFAQLGERIAQMLSLADAEAVEMKEAAADDVRAQLKDAATQADALTSAAEAAAAEHEAKAQHEATRLLAQAARDAEDRLASADREAATRLAEAQAVQEQQRAQSAQAAADFEATLAARRQAAEEQFTEQIEAADRALQEAVRRRDQALEDAAAARAACERDTRRMVAEAQDQAEAIVGEAKASADRLRADSERELAAIAQRRDSIDAQLTNVRQMLATLTGQRTSGPASASPGPEATPVTSTSTGQSAGGTDDDYVTEDPHATTTDESDLDADQGDRHAQ